MGEVADALRLGASRGPGGHAGVVDATIRPPVDSPREPSAGGREPQELRAPEPAILSEGRVEVEACRQLALRLRSELERHQARSVAVVSALRGEGKTTTSANLALSLASLDTDRRVALVGLDLRRPSLGGALGLDFSIGVEEVLAGRASLDDARVPIERPGLDVFPAKVPQRTPHEILTGRHLSGLISALEQRYDTIIFDTPPVLLVPDTRLILEHVPVCVPVARAGRTRVRSFRLMLDALPQGQVLSTLLNCARRSSHYYEGYDYVSELDVDPTDREPSPRRRRSDKPR